MEKIKKCGICKKNINLKKDNYNHVKDYLKGEFYSEGYYHNRCYLDRINKGTQLQQKAESLLNRTMNLLDKTQGKQEEEYVIG